MMEMRIDVSKQNTEKGRRGEGLVLKWKRIDVCAVSDSFQIAIVALLAVVSNLSVIECGQWVVERWYVKLNAHLKWIFHNLFFFFFTLLTLIAKPSKSKCRIKSTQFIIITPRRCPWWRRLKFPSSKVSVNWHKCETILTVISTKLAFFFLSTEVKVPYPVHVPVKGEFVDSNFLLFSWLLLNISSIHLSFSLVSVP